MPVSIAQLESTRWLEFRNDAGETIPPFAVMRVTGAAKDDPTGIVYLTVAKPSAGAARSHLINGPTQVLSGGYGSGTFEPAMALYDLGDGTPAEGETWGPKSGQWTLAINRPGFVVLGGVIAGTGARVFVRELATPTRTFGALYAPASYLSSPTETKIGWSGAYPFVNCTADVSTDDITLDLAGSYRCSLSLHMHSTGVSAPTIAGPSVLVKIKRGTLVMAAKEVHCPRINGTNIWVDVECDSMRDDFSAGDKVTATCTANESITFRDGTLHVEKID